MNRTGRGVSMGLLIMRAVSRVPLVAAILLSSVGWVADEARAATGACEPPPVWDDRPEAREGAIGEETFDDPAFQAGRARVDRNGTPALAYAETQHEQFAGIFVDELAGLVYLAFTDDLSQHAQALRATVPDPEAIRVVSADHSLAKLQRIQNQIGADNAALRERGLEVTAVGADQRNNRVWVMLAEVDAEAMNELCTRYGSDVFIFEEGAARPVAIMPGASEARDPSLPPWPLLLVVGATAVATWAGLQRRRGSARSPRSTT